MAKFYGKVGFSAGSHESTPGVWTESIVERDYFGDVTRNTRRLQGTEYLNDKVTFGNEISIVSDPYALEFFHAIRYVEWMGARWKVTSVEVQYPRLILSMGEVYNGPTPETA